MIPWINFELWTINFHGICLINWNTFIYYDLLIFNVGTSGYRLHDASKLNRINNDTNNTIIVAMPRLIYHSGWIIYFYDLKLRVSGTLSTPFGTHTQFDKFEFGIDCTWFNFRLLAYGSSNGFRSFRTFAINIFVLKLGIYWLRSMHIVSVGYLFVAILSFFFCAHRKWCVRVPKWVWPESRRACGSLLPFHLHRIASVEDMIRIPLTDHIGQYWSRHQVHISPYCVVVSGTVAAFVERLMCMQCAHFPSHSRCVYST